MDCKKNPVEQKKLTEKSVAAPLRRGVAVKVGTSVPASPQNSQASHEGTKIAENCLNVAQTFLSANDNNGRQECLPHIPLLTTATTALNPVNLVNPVKTAVKNSALSAPPRENTAVHSVSSVYSVVKFP